MRIRKSMSIAPMKLTQPAMFGLFIACMGTVVVAAQQPTQVVGKTNLHGWIDEVPGLPKSLDEATARKNGNYPNGGSFYQPFYDKVAAFKKAFKQTVSGGVKPDETAMRKAAETQVNSNLARLPELAEEQS
jgi:hypothetical protein